MRKNAFVQIQLLNASINQAFGHPVVMAIRTHNNNDNEYLLLYIKDKVSYFERIVIDTFVEYTRTLQLVFDNDFKTQLTQLSHSVMSSHEEPADLVEFWNIYLSKQFPYHICKIGIVNKELTFCRVTPVKEMPRDLSFREDIKEVCFLNKNGAHIGVELLSLVLSRILEFYANIYIKELQKNPNLPKLGPLPSPATLVERPYTLDVLEFALSKVNGLLKGRGWHKSYYVSASFNGYLWSVLIPVNEKTIVCKHLREVILAVEAAVIDLKLF